jgi:alkylhydroperoxidase/carboxymuconolactone decarboxylase family protein YurZ
MTEYHSTLRRLAVRDDKLITCALSSESGNRAASRLDPKTYAFVRLSAMIAVGASEYTLRPVVEAAQEAGATTEEIVGTLLAVMPVTGVPRAVAAAPAIGLAIGYDVLDALELPDEADVPTRKEPR